MSRFKRSLILCKASWNALKQQPSLLWLPILSSLTAIIWLALFILPLIYTNFTTALFQDSKNIEAVLHSPLSWLWVVALYFISFVNAMYFNAAMCYCASELLKGHPTSVGKGLSMANKRIFLIMQWALITSTVGAVLKGIEEQLGFIGRFVVGLIGLAWAATSYMVVPVMVIEGKSPLTALKESAVVLKKTWGESLMGFTGISFVFSMMLLALIMLTSILAIVLFAQNLAFLAIALIVMSIALTILTGLLQSCLSSVYKMALYQYAVTGLAPGEFDQELLVQSAKSKKGRK